MGRGVLCQHEIRAAGEGAADDLFHPRVESAFTFVARLSSDVVSHVFDEQAGVARSSTIANAIADQRVVGPLLVISFVAQTTCAPGGTGKCRASSVPKSRSPAL